MVCPRKHPFNKSYSMPPLSGLAAVVATCVSWLHDRRRSRPSAGMSGPLMCALSFGTTACSEPDAASSSQQTTPSVAQEQPLPTQRTPTYARVPAGQVAMTSEELRSTFVGKRYVDIQHRSAIVTEAFESDGSYRYESDYHNFGGIYWITNEWLCRRWDEPERPLTTCSQVYVLPTGAISYVAPGNGRFQHYKIAP